MLVRKRCWQLLVASFLLPVLTGCTDSGYPDVKATTFIGRSAPCAQCDRTIPNVTEKNLMTFQGVVYPVCNEECAEELKRWLEQQ